MPFPELAHSTVPLTEAQADALVLALPPLDAAGDALDAWPGLASALTALAFTGAPGAQQRVFLPAISSLPLIIVGTGDAPDAAAVRDAVGSVLRTTTGFESLAVAAPLAAPELWRAAAEGAVLGGYRFDDYKSDGGKRRATRVIVHTPQELTEADLAEVTAVGDAAALVKDLVNTPAEWQSPAQLADSAVQSVAELPVTVTVLDEKQLQEQGFGGILGVGQGSARPPRLVRLDYAPEGAERHVALVGKGITFDSGGLSLKPAVSMVGMKYDMCGAAVVLAVVRAAAALQLPVRVSGWLCIADNMPSGHATRPGDVLRMLDGTTVEVLNTDAEGRLVMADGLVAASRERPDVLVDVATLTGAVIVALGTRHTGVMGEDAAVQAFLEAAGRAGEDAWALPLPTHMEEELDSPIADMQNSKIGDSAGGTMFAGLFLQRFVGRISDAPDAERIPWVHLDIAGSGWNKGAGFGATDKGPTAAAVRSLIEFVAAGGH
ncbi:leucyl aminopeptidase [Microbacterium sp. zg.Y625]|uniref:leucyl aminopeptidase n=1 Tax=Microbacterium jiangjiandongii TaxID=3049071 RepID=UPI00214B01D9|nr:MULTISPECIES: leucyl aminopeptidase [unclassified Microbacterium]MCR2792725.1 leucyl aminopeptidase [Microbacterium sp. zg.Y625]WIM26702.1 leucyl aminopeptidase [Microbacterium sp. zg-Y625]